MLMRKSTKQREQDELARILDEFRSKKHLLGLFLESVSADFLTNPELNTGVPTVIHSIRKRIKDEGHLKAKILRKRQGGRVINEKNLFTEITDFAGIRILHLHQSQFTHIHKFIMQQIKSKVWRLVESPVAYTWDPESVDFFNKYKISTTLKPSYYTSVHYLIAPANKQDGVCCEIQVRTLFEEIWGEIDHSINYPEATRKMASLEQIRVLSKLVSTGSRLADSIFKVHNAS